MLRRTIFLTAAALAATTAPAAAQVAPPQLAPLKPCYVAATEEQREWIAISGTGFTPFAMVDVFVDGIQQITSPPPQAGFDGSLAGSVRAPFIEEGQRTFTLRATEHDNLADSVMVSSKVTRLSVEQRPAAAATSDRVRFVGRGFTDLTKPVYAHYVFAGRSRKTVRIGLPTGDCGRFSVRRRQFTFKRSPQVGVWTIQFDQQPRYSAKASPRVPLTIRVRRTVKPQS